MFRRSTPVAAAVAVGIFAATSARGQWTEQKTLTLDGAHKVISAIVAEAGKRRTTGAIAVVDDGGNLMAVERIDGTFVAGGLISIGKARTAALFKKPTSFFEDLINKGRTAMTTVNDFTPLRGGVPITVEGTIIGAVGVSGAASATEDEELAVLGAAAVRAAAPAKVSFYDRGQVQEAFAKGSVLFDQGERYMVHASRRDGSGQAEVHARDADIIYVLDGNATLVTGGTVVEPKTTAPDEVRGRGIQGGETRSLEEGDVVIIPAGTPHWFEKVPGPFTYYVVKVR
jgi:glc operon protein GlcG